MNTGSKANLNACANPQCETVAENIEKSPKNEVDKMQEVSETVSKGIRISNPKSNKYIKKLFSGSF